MLALCFYTVLTYKWFSPLLDLDRTQFEDWPLMGPGVFSAFVARNFTAGGAWPRTTFSAEIRIHSQKPGF